MLPQSVVWDFVEKLKLYYIIDISEDNINSIISLIDIDKNKFSGNISSFLSNIETSKKCLRNILYDNLEKAKKFHEAEITKLIHK